MSPHNEDLRRPHTTQVCRDSAHHALHDARVALLFVAQIKLRTAYAGVICARAGWP